jgi:hypothetical protein
MSAAFLTGALAAGVTGAALTALAIWLVTLVSGSAEPWGVAPLLVTAAGALLAVATYVAERLIYHRSMDRKRATGEPWAFRED